MKFHNVIGVTLLLAPLLLAPMFRQGQTVGPAGLYIATGDSIAAGIGASLPRERSYPAIVHAWMADLSDASVPMVNLARPGETAATFTTDGQLDELRSEVTFARDTGVPIAAVTVSLGGNEILQTAGSGISNRQVALTDFETALDTALSEIRTVLGPDVPVILTTYYDPTGSAAAAQFSDSWWIAQFNTVIEDTASEHGCTVAGVAEEFAGNIDEFTHFPADVHPTNRGYRAIAQQVWASLNFDNKAPVVDVRSPDVATRSTPTLQFDVSDNVGVAELLVHVGDEASFDPVELLDGSWVALLDLTGAEGNPIEVGIVATDDAGNVTTVTHAIELSID